MIIKLSNFFALFLLLIYTNMFANTISLTPSTQNISILENSSLFIDKNSTKTISEILKQEKQFTPLLHKYMNYGYKFKDTFWIKFSVKNESDKDIVKYLVFDSPDIDIINLYFTKNAKRHILEDGIFNRKSFKSELSFSFPLAIQANKTITYYLELKPITHSLHFSLKIKDYKTFKNDELHHQLILTIFFSILLTVIIYNGVIYTYTKDTIYIYYSFLVLSIFIHHLSLTGMVAYFLPSNPEIITQQAYMPAYNLALIDIAVFMFARNFLNLYKYKKIYFLLKSFIFIVLLISVLQSRDNYILNYMTFVTLLMALFMSFISLYLFVYTKEKNAKYFFFIWNIALFGMIGTILYYVGILTTAIPYLFETTIIIEVLCFSIILASQIKDLQEERIEKNKMIYGQSKLAAMGEMLQNIAHQWRQPLSEINGVVMKIDADFYKNRLDATTLEKDISRIESITYHMSNTLESFSSYFKENKQQDTTTLKLIVHKTLAIMDGSLRDIDVKVYVEDESIIKINISELIQVILVILNNAVDVLVAKNIKNKRIIIRVKKSNDEHILEIEDNGGGIQEKNIQRIFEPYFTTKFKSNGIGIGLYMARMLTQESLNGKLTVSNTQNGARFKITL